MSAQHYDDRVARERMSRGLCPECGSPVSDHTGLGGGPCLLTDLGVAARIATYADEEAAAGG